MLPLPDLTADHVEAATRGLAHIQDKDERRVDVELLPSELAAFERARERGLLVYDQEKLGRRMALLIAWELECARLRRPAVWVLLGEPGEARLGASTWTSGQVVTLRGWNALRVLCQEQGVTRGNVVKGVFALTPSPASEAEALALRLLALVSAHLHGPMRNRLGYSLVWSALGVVWERKRRSSRAGVEEVAWHTTTAPPPTPPMT